MDISLPKRIMLKLIRQFSPRHAHDLMVKEVTKTHNMRIDRDEEFYARIYLEFINRALSGRGLGSLKILDAGSGDGRICLPLAEAGHKVDAVDFTGCTLSGIRRSAGVKTANISCFNREISEFIADSPDCAYDCVICTEVTYMLKNYDQVINGLARVLRPGGLLVLSVRPKLFYILDKIRNNDLLGAFSVCRNNDGHERNWFFNWYLADELKQKLAVLGILDIQCFGIGVCSGIEGDPQAGFCRPSKLDDAQKARLFEIEMELALLYPDCGRYILAIGRKE